MQWQSRVFAMSNESDGYEGPLIDTGFWTPVLAKHGKVFGEQGKLPAANWSNVKIEIAVFDACDECVTLEEENQTFLLSETHYFNDESHHLLPNGITIS